uniref:RNA-directed DNA polymerase n=1 Tax=Haemonchus contortus TaxID=6289 RepID=A0A7I4YHH5_HAECO
MLAALDAPDGNIYAEVKQVAMRLEKLQAGASLPNSSQQGSFQRRVMDRQPTESRKIFPPGETSDQPRTQPFAKPIKCYTCGKEGHVAVDCRKRGKPTGRNHRDNGHSDGSSKGRNGPPLGSSLVTELDRWCKTVQSIGKEVGPHPSAVGKPSTCEVEIFGVAAKALVDTGSVVSIVPVGLLKQVRERGVDLDAKASIVGDGKQRKLYDASGNAMGFLSEIVTEVTVVGAGKASVHLHVQQSKDDTLLLGTNALSELGISLRLTPYKDRDVTKDLHPNMAYSDRRVVVAPGKIATVQIRGSFRDGACVFWSKSPRIESGVCQVNQGKAELSVINQGSESWVIGQGEDLGTWSAETWIDPKIVDVPSDMMVLQQHAVLQDAERTHALVDILNKNRKAGVIPDELCSVIEEYSDVFAVSDKELTQTNVVTHDIDVGGNPPIRQKTRPVPYGIRADVDTMLRDLKERNVIEDSQSPWASPIVLVAKKDGTTRLCVDYREVNKVTKKDSYPLPPIDITLQNLLGKRWFTSLDLASGYWQVPLSERAKEISAFTTTSGQFQFRVLPFGLTTAPAKFQRLMDKVLGDLIGPEVSVYIDDILIATDSIPRHADLLRKVLLAFRKAQLKVKPQKCRIMEPSLEFLGHVVDADGVRADPEKVGRIKDYARPQNVAQLRTFLGMAGYYRKFVLRFSQISKPLFDLTSPKRKFVWSHEHEEAFEALKKTLMEAPVLAQPNIEKARDGSRPFIIYTDASRIGIGAVLAQEGDDSLLHPVFFASKHLSGAERNYHVTDQEALALIFSLKKFHYFIYGVPSIVRTDHSALTSLFKRTNVSPRVLRWALEVQRYDITIEYVKGTANAVADALSRGLPHSSILTPGYAEDEKVVCSIQAHDWLLELREDPDFATLIKSVESGVTEEVKLPRHSKVLSTTDFTLQNGSLNLINENGSLAAVVPRSQRRNIFEEAHSGTLGGHFNAKKMFIQMKKSLFWPGMLQDLVSWCRGCQKCFLTNGRAGNVPPLRPLAVTRPLQIVGVDLLEMGLTTQGNRYIVTVIDHFTKYLGAYAVADKKAETIAQAIFSNWVCGAGRWPEILLSDRGGEFENEIMEALCKVMGIEQKFTKGYCPRENGLTERVNGTIVKMLKKKTVIAAEWDKILPAVVYAYNASPHRATGESPHFLVYGYDPVYPSISIPSEHLSPYVVDYDNYKAELLCGLKLARECINENSNEYRDSMKLAYDKRYKTVKSTIFKTGDRVYMKLPSEKGKSRHPKLTTDWSGPFRVIEASTNSALITLIGENKEPLRVQFDHLLKVPREIDDTRLTGKTQRGRRKKTVAAIQAMPANSKDLMSRFLYFSTVTSSSTNVRNIDWTCPGEIVVNGQHVACTANAPINSPLPFAPLLSTLTFRSPYDFARLIAIMTQSHIPEHFRVARMLDSSYDTVTIKSIGFAISFYRAHCIHMTLATVADARGVTQGYLPRSKSDPYNLPNMYVDAVKFANENPWTEMSWRLVKPRRTLIVLPEGFQGVLDCFESPLMTAKLAIEPDDIQAAWFEEEEWSAIMLFSPARYVVASRWMNAWFLLVQAVAKGAELYVLPGPKDDRSWGITVDLLRDFAEETVVQRPPLKQRIHCLLPLKSEEHVCDAPFKILADKMNLATGPYFTQSAAKRFWTATRKHYSSMIRLPECQRVPEPKRRFGDRAPQQAAAHSSRDHRFNRPLNSGPPKQQRNRSFSRPPVFAERQNFERRSLRGKKLGRGGRF